MLENIPKLEYASETISGRFPRAVIKIISDGRRRRLEYFWNHFILHVTTALNAALIIMCI